LHCLPTRRSSDLVTPTRSKVERGTAGPAHVPRWTAQMDGHHLGERERPEAQNPAYGRLTVTPPGQKLSALSSGYQACARRTASCQRSRSVGAVGSTVARGGRASATSSQPSQVPT